MIPTTVKRLIKVFQDGRKQYEKDTGKKIFDPFEILKEGTPYNVVFGERSNGKTTGAIFASLLDWFDTGRPFVVLRRYDEALKPVNANLLFAWFIAQGWPGLITRGEYDGIGYRSREWYWTRKEPDGSTTRGPSFAYARALTQYEHDKSSGDVNYKNIVFDEFITRNNYLIDEFVIFSNVLSTLIRNKTDVRVWMCGNSVNPYCPYWREMGLGKVKDMKPGAINVYTYGDSRLKVAVQRTEPSGGDTSSGFYFAFDNPRLQMITSGDWEIESHPHTPRGVRPCDIRFTFIVLFDGETLHADVVNRDNATYIAVHPKTTPIKDPDRDLVYQIAPDPRRNYRVGFNNPQSGKERAILELIQAGKVFFSDNMTGETWFNYLKSV